MPAKVTLKNIPIRGHGHTAFIINRFAGKPAPAREIPVLAVIPNTIPYL
jgi:hypothetical protein